MTAYALFTNVENPFQDTARAFREMVETVRHAERLGFEQAWVTEHHFNPFSISASLFPVLAHLAARTERIGLGAGAALLPLHDPVRMAEDIATVDALSEGRLLLGVARGGPFPDQFRHFHVAPEQSRARLFEALELIERALADAPVDYRGEHYSYQDLSLFPRPIRARLPVWLASLAHESVALAAGKNYGLMAPSAASLESVRGAMETFRRLGGTSPLVVSRYFFCHPDRRRAREEAAPFIRDFARNMRVAIASAPARGESPLAFGLPATAYEEDALLAKAVVGDVGECIEQCEAIADALGEHVLMLKPASYDAASSREALTLFAERVRPALRSHESLSPVSFSSFTPSQGESPCAKALPNP